MKLAPEPILRAGNDTVSWACIFCRNQTLRDGASSKMINELMEAIHEIPRMMFDWGRHDLKEVRIHLGCFNSSHWTGAPDLVAYFDNRLKDYGWQDS